MAIGGAFRELAAFLDECEQRGTRIGGVDVTDSALQGDALAADVELTLSTGSGAGGDAMTACTPDIESDGTLRLAFESTGSLVPIDDYDLTVEPDDATVAADGSVVVTLSATVPSTEPASDDAGDDHGSDDTRPAVRDSDVPPFRNPDLLGEVYESCDTFAEMSDALEMDVTAETVRRYMIDYGIHQPTSYETSSDDDADGSASGDGDARPSQPVVLSDGIGLSDEVTVDTLVETVKQSNTIYEVTQDVGMDRQDALAMLRELNLLDLVVGRLATEAERDISREDVVARLREASATQ